MDEHERPVLFSANGFQIYGDCPRCGRHSITIEKCRIETEVIEASVHCDACGHREELRPGADELPSP